MKILPQWLREFVSIPVDEVRLAEDLTMAGISVEAVIGEGGDTAYEVDLTPNRVDAISHYGVARDLSAVYDTELKALDAPASSSGPGPFKIEIEDAQGCARYVAQIVRGVTVMASPAKIGRRLELLDSRPINNVADASNYTLHEMGHPTHCFDLDLLEGGKIVVRRAYAGEVLRTLDGVERKLAPEDLIIADAKKAVAIAGVMGGFDTMITERTRNVLIESAWFDPASVRRTARRLGMHTDASHRFERGADIGAAPIGCARVAKLILETAGGTLDGGAIDAYPRKLHHASIGLRHSEVRRILGIDIDDGEITRILRRLGFAVTQGGGGAVVRRESVTPAGSGGAHAALAERAIDWVVAAPSWRLDVTREIDVIEEIARIYGYNRFPNTLPRFAGSVVVSPEAQKRSVQRSELLALGYSEGVSVSFISRGDAAQFSSASAVALANPISEEATVMRSSMLPGMLRMVEYNLNRGNADVRLFEMGSVFEQAGSAVAEQERLCLGATGAAEERDVHHAERKYGFFDLKGAVEAVLGRFEYKALYFDEHGGEYLHPGRAARAVMDGATVARFGQLHPSVAAARKIKAEVYVAEIDCGRLFQHALRQPSYREVSAYPAVDRDFSFLFGEEVTWERIQSAIGALKIAEMIRLVPVERLAGGSVAAVPAGKYSLLLRAEFQAADRTLRDDEVALWSAQIVKALEALGGRLRT